jgi:hypothetical protein
MRSSSPPAEVFTFEVLLRCLVRVSALQVLLELPAAAGQTQWRSGGPCGGVLPGEGVELTA